MAIIAKYKFNPSLYADYLPVFNNEFTGYTKTDVNNSDGTITRTISHDTLKPTYMRFGVAINSSTDREKSLIEVIKCDTSEVTNMGNMFSGCNSLISLNVSNFNTSKATNMQYMFNGCSLLTSLDLSNFDTSKVTNFDSIFENCTSLATINVSSWDTSKVTNMAYMFNNCNKLTSLDLSNFNTSQVTSMFKMFQSCFSLTSLDVSSFDTSKVTNISNMFLSCKSLTSLDVSNFNTSNVTTMNNMFNNCNKLTLLDVSSFNTSKVTSMAYMFANCSSLTLLNLSNFDTSNITNMDSIFENCSSLTSLDLSNFDTSNITTMQYMFNNCSSLTLLNLSNFNTSNVTTMYYMFNGCNKLTLLDVSSFNTSKVTSMAYMFANCSSLTLLNLSNFDTSNITNMDSIFENCSSLTSLNVSSFDTSKVTNMQYMFNNCKSLTSLDVSNFNTSQVTNMRNIFSSCSKLTTLDLSNFDTSQVTNMAYMLSDCIASDIGLLYASSSTINSLLTPLGTSVARNIYYTDAPLDELTIQDNIIYKKYELTMATFPYTLNKLPNGVADYIDVVNKVHVQRVGRIVLDGTQTFTYSSKHSNANYYGYVMTLSSNRFATNAAYGLCDKLQYQRNYNFPWATDGNYVIAAGNQLFIKLSKDKLNSNNAVSSLTNYLTSNPITVLYELETPIYTPLTEEEIAQLPLSAYANGYVNLSSDQLMPSFEFRMRASNRYQVDMLETGYYYLNAPVGNVKLGTANVNVQQMPCVIKVDNVGTGDSGYRLGFSGNIMYTDVTSTFGGFIANDGTIITGGEGDSYTDFIKVKPKRIISATTYIETPIGRGYGVIIGEYDSNKNFIKINTTEEKTITTTTTDNTYYIRVSYRCGLSDNIKKIKIGLNPFITLAKLPSHRIPTTFTQGMKCGINFGYWEGIKVAKPYSFRTRSTGGASVEEQSLTNIPELNRIERDNIIVEDEFDIATGKFTKRVGKVVLDGSSDENWTSTNRYLVKTASFRLTFSAKSRENYICVSDRMPLRVGWDGDSERLWIDNRESLIVHTDKAFTVDDFRKYLDFNPIIVYYPLEVPEISYISLSANQIKTTTDATLIQSSKYNELYLNPQVKPSHLTYPVPSLVGNRTYTVVHNRKNISGSTKPIELNLGGTVVQLNDASSKTLVKTPSTLVHSNLIFIGGESTVDHIMVLDGDWTNKPIEYFENMKGHDTDAIITIIGDSKIDDVAEQYLW